MLPTTRGFIYSPRHYKEYSREVDGRGVGFGLWVEDDIAAWNFAWLSFPGLDLYLQPTITAKAIEEAIDAQLFGKVTALALPSMAEFYPGLRSALLGHPKQLKPVLDCLDLLGTAAGQLGGKAWVGTVYARLGSLVGETLAPDARPPTPKPSWKPNGGNVVYANFGKKPQTS